MYEWPTTEPVFVLPLEGNPIVVYGESLTAVKFWRRPTGRDMIALSRAGLKGFEGTSFMATRLTLIPAESLGDMDAYDFDRMDDVLQAFLAHGPKAKISISPAGLLLVNSPGSETQRSSS